MDSTSDRLLRANRLGDLVRDRLLADIITGRYAAGEKLSLDAISEECGISRTPVREALQALSMIGFVDVSRNARTSVAEWSVDDMRERLVVIGRLAAFLALGTTDPALAPRYIRADLVPDFRRYLDLASNLISTGLPRVAPYMQTAFLGPLRLFLQPDVLQNHGVDTSVGEPDRRRLLTEALDAFSFGEAHQAAAALASYGDALTAALTRPSVGLGSGARGTNQSPELLTRGA